MGPLFAAAVGIALAVPQAVWSRLPDLCLFHRLVALPCPTCGLTRSWSALLHGELGQAVRFHLLGPALLMGLAGLLAVSLFKGRLCLPRRGWLACLAFVWASYGLARILGWLPPPPPTLAGRVLALESRS